MVFSLSSSVSLKLYLEKLIKFEKISTGADQKSPAASTNLLPVLPNLVGFVNTEKTLRGNDCIGVGFGECIINTSTIILFVDSYKTFKRAEKLTLAVLLFA